MAFFKFRWPLGGEPKGRESRSPRNAQPESVEVMRRRARHRLIGAAVLVLAGVLGFPLLFDTQPRPIPVDIPIVIPDRNKTAPLPLPQVSGERMAAGSGIAADEEVVPPRAAEPKPEVKPQPKAEIKSEPKPAESSVAQAVDAPKKEAKTEPRKEVTKPEIKAEAKTDHKVEPRPEPKPEPKPKTEPKPEPRNDDAARAKALLEGKSAPETAPADAARFIVQVGAFSDANKAREARAKLEKAGLKTYTQVVDTADGKRIRVRVGPFANKAEADKAAGRIKGLDLAASILTL